MKKKATSALPTKSDRRQILRRSIVGFRVNEDEAELVEAKREQYGFESVSDMLRTAFNEMVKRRG